MAQMDAVSPGGRGPAPKATLTNRADTSHPGPVACLQVSKAQQDAGHIIPFASTTAETRVTLKSRTQTENKSEPVNILADGKSNKKLAQQHSPKPSYHGKI